MVVPVGFPKLPPGKPGLSGTYTSGSGFYLTRITARQQPASQLAAFLHLPEEMPIVDKTGLTGKYDFTLEYATDLPGASRPEGSTLPAATVFTALQEQLGLQLVAKKLPFDVVVVDAVDRTPTEN